MSSSYRVLFYHFLFLTCLTNIYPHLICWYKTLFYHGVATHLTSFIGMGDFFTCCCSFLVVCSEGFVSVLARCLLTRKTILYRAGIHAHNDGARAPTMVYIESAPRALMSEEKRVTILSCVFLLCVGLSPWIPPQIDLCFMLQTLFYFWTSDRYSRYICIHA